MQTNRDEIEPLFSLTKLSTRINDQTVYAFSYKKNAAAVKKFNGAFPLEEEVYLCTEAQAEYAKKNKCWPQESYTNLTLKYNPAEIEEKMRLQPVQPR
jgi:hypothetical protein